MVEVINTSLAPDEGIAVDVEFIEPESKPFLGIIVADGVGIERAAVVVGFGGVRGDADGRGEVLESFFHGAQSADTSKDFNFYALAVRSGDVAAATSVPEPTTVALLGIGLAGMAVYGVRRRRQRR